MNVKKILWGALFIISLIICIICGYKIFSYMTSDGGDVKQYISETNPETGTSTEKTTLAENHQIDWVKLQEDNPDIYSWIYIPNTNVDYPVVQASEYEDDSFYLNHNINKQSEFAGSIYSEKQNARDYSDPVTILYGHNMKNGSMFKTLHQFEQATFFNKNQYMYVYMPKHKLTYEIYSAYIYDDRHILNSFVFSDKKVLKKYFKYTQNPESLTKNTRPVDLTAKSKILTLSTCTNGAENTRYLVQGVLIKDEPTE